MLDPLAIAMANDALRDQHARFDPTPARQREQAWSVGRIRVGVARRLRAVADLIEPAAGTTLAAEATADVEGERAA
jgi:hypothetical protein